MGDRLYALDAQKVDKRIIMVKYRIPYVLYNIEG